MVGRRLTGEEAAASRANRRRRVAENVRRHREASGNQIADERRLQKDYLGLMDVLCSHCNAVHFCSEKVANKG